MSGYFEKPDHWRMRADMTRTIAEGMPTEDARRILLRIATDYERMAKRLENERVQQQPKKAPPIAPAPVDTDDMNARLVALQRKFQKVGS